MTNPVGSWTGLYFSEEVKAFKKWGYHIEIIEGIEFSKIYPFTEWVNHFYRLKQESLGSARFLNKLLLNGLYGYFGRMSSDSIIEVIKEKDLDEIIQCFDVYFIIESENTDDLIIKRGKKPIKRIKEISLDKYISLLKIYLVKQNEMLNVAISSAIASYSRIHMGEYLKDCAGKENVIIQIQIQ